MHGFFVLRRMRVSRRFARILWRKAAAAGCKGRGRVAARADFPRGKTLSAGDNLANASCKRPPPCDSYLRRLKNDF
ncbi:MAG: hypothetical protein CR217_01050 [Beijerinckiaceae bacterium]|nr:MAG: hypothetical protein CR217_01050 [Beijerinckiaceae bacterium]